jgi:DNA (cytosine-5)-methyltransferase 1
MLQAILLATVHLRNSQKNLWSEVLSRLIVVQENTKYARINNENEEAVITESGTLHIKSELQDVRQYFALQHLRGTARPQVFPFGEAAGATDEGLDQGNTEVASTLRSRYGNGTGSHIQQLNQPTHSNDRVYGADGISPTLNTMQGGNRQPFVAQEDLMIRDGRDNRSCLRSGRTPELSVKGMSIRRLTPIECERLQGFEDGWTEGVSDTQRYKTLGNAVTVNVIQDIFERILTVDNSPTTPQNLV